MMGGQRVDVGTTLIRSYLDRDWPVHVDWFKPFTALHFFPTCCSYDQDTTCPLLCSQAGECENKKSL